MDQPFQRVGDGKAHDRTDHVWVDRPGCKVYRWKCVLCGVLAQEPPPYPTPERWHPRYFELPLTDGERQMAPPNHDAEPPMGVKV